MDWSRRSSRQGIREGICLPVLHRFDEAADRNFGDVDLERVTSHVDSGDGLRWLILELVEMGWDTAAEIEEFLTETLYW